MTAGGILNSTMSETFVDFQRVFLAYNNSD